MQNDKYILAAKHYDDMLENYRNLMDDRTDIESADRFLYAAMDLAQLNLSNPFSDLDGYAFKENAAIRPSSQDKIVTGVYEQ